MARDRTRSTQAAPPCLDLLDVSAEENDDEDEEEEDDGSEDVG